MKKCIYTVITDNYDYPFDHSIKAAGFDYICFTDNPVQSDFWEMRPIPEDIADLSPVRQNRAIKIRPHIYLPEYDYSIYIDANYDLKSYPSVSGKIFSVNKHERRNCLYDEAQVCIYKNLDDIKTIQSQVDLYRANNMPKNYGLWHCNYMARYHNDPDCISIMNDWWEEVKNGSFRDQISLPYVLWQHSYIPGNMSFDLLEYNSHLKYGREREILPVPTYNAEINPRIAVCCIERLENAYIREFVEHYRSLGFGHIFMYDTNAPDQDNVYDVIGDYIDSGYVEVIKWSGKPVLEVRQAYNECYYNRLSNYDWCLFVDPDEFLELYKQDNITDYLNRFTAYDAVRINWRTMDDNDLIRQDNRPLRQRFTRASNDWTDMQVKSIIKTGLPKVDFIHNGSPHCIYSSNNQCNNEGRMIKDIWSINIQDPNWNDAAIKHYRCKTMEEYIKNKKVKLKDYHNINFNMRYFFRYNIPTPQKIELYERIDGEMGRSNTANT